MPAPFVFKIFYNYGRQGDKSGGGRSSSHEAMVTVDGQNGYEVRGGDVIHNKKVPDKDAYGQAEWKKLFRCVKR